MYLFCATRTAACSPAGWPEICADVRKNFDGVLGIHTHNDSDVGVANALSAVDQGFAHVQGCMNGYGERCGNASLTSIIANLELKMGHTTIGKERLGNLTAAARFIAELANFPMRNDQPYVGHSAFAHKGGVHVSAVLKGFFHLRAHQSENRGQPPTRSVERPFRTRQRALQAEAVRS